MVVMGPVFVIFNIGFFAFYVRQTVKQLSWPGGTVLLPPCRGAIFCVINKALPVADFMLMSMTSPTVSTAQSVKNTKSICRSAYAFAVLIL